MTKQLNFNRINKKKYAEEFQQKFSSTDWPPEHEKDLLIRIINDVLTGMIVDEIKEILIPQVKDMQTTINSNTLSNEIFNMKRAFNSENSTSFKEYYINVSDAIFKEAEVIAPTLLGQEDSCGWLI